MGGGGGGQDPRKKTFTLPPRQSLLMQTLNTNYRPIQQGWLAWKVSGTFYGDTMMMVTMMMVAGDWARRQGILRPAAPV